MAARELAREVGVVTQAEEIAFPMTRARARRHGPVPAPRRVAREGGPIAPPSSARWTRCEVTRPRADRSVLELSGGERQRARLAARSRRSRARSCSTSRPRARHRARDDALRDARRVSRDDGVTVVVVTHNINLAARYADRLVLLDGGRIVAVGTPATCSHATHRAVYHWPVAIRTRAARRRSSRSGDRCTHRLTNFPRRLDHMRRHDTSGAGARADHARRRLNRRAGAARHVPPARGRRHGHALPVLSRMRRAPSR
jgi:ABC-type hemin transport system ATPase subunit